MDARKIVGEYVDSKHAKRQTHYRVYLIDEHKSNELINSKL